jgi:hypothetical protein
MTSSYRHSKNLRAFAWSCLVLGVIVTINGLVSDERSRLFVGVLMLVVGLGYLGYIYGGKRP